MWFVWAHSYEHKLVTVLPLGFPKQTVGLVEVDGWIPRGNSNMWQGFFFPKRAVGLVVVARNWLGRSINLSKSRRGLRLFLPGLVSSVVRLMRNWSFLMVLALWTFEADVPWESHLTLSSGPIDVFGSCKWVLRMSRERLCCTWLGGLRASKCRWGTSDSPSLKVLVEHRRLSVFRWNLRSLIGLWGLNEDPILVSFDLLQLYLTSCLGLFVLSWFRFLVLSSSACLGFFVLLPRNVLACWYQISHLRCLWFWLSFKRLQILGFARGLLFGNVLSLASVLMSFKALRIFGYELGRLQIDLRCLWSCETSRMSWSGIRLITWLLCRGLSRCGWIFRMLPLGRSGNDLSELGESNGLIGGVEEFGWYVMCVFGRWR